MPPRLIAAFTAIWAFRPYLRHGPFAAALIGGALLRWTAVRAYPQGLWFTGDSYFYMGYALRPKPSGSKTLGYSFLLRLMEPLHSLKAVVVVQHLMGLAIAVMIYALLCRARLPAWAAAIVSLPVLYDAYQIELEHLLMSEALFTFAIMAGLTLLLWRPPVWWTALPAGVLLGYAVLVRSAGAPLIPVILLVLLLRPRGRPPRLLPRLLPRARPDLRPALAFGVAAAVPLVAYAMWFHAERGTYGLTTADGIYLWGRTAQFADCAKIDPPADEQGLCLDAATKAEKDPPGHLIWRNDIPPRERFRSVITPEANKTLRSFAIRAILAQPGDYLHVVGHGVHMAFSHDRAPVPTPGTEGLYHFPDRPQLFTPGRSFGGGGTALTDAMRYGRTDRPSQVVQPQADRLIDYQEKVFLPGPALGVLFALGAVGLAAARWRRREVLLAWGTAATLLLFPIASADFDYRYVVPPMPFACLAVGLALSAFRARRPEPVPAGAEPVEPGPGPEGVESAETEPPEGESSEDGSSETERGVSRWWENRGSRHRDSGRASAP
ncbi:hypothetical protein [Actinomadura terrae]|uniref:hypothetical protein n=1 Tax=Actinomadura terrae TaxID=604353 RepID=UPI001FA7F6D9|nr:hypothetical protein [Actinomadura terrae]